MALLHGFGNDRRTWHDTGWVQRLSGDHTVITVDLRGCGETSVFADPVRYAPVAHLDDLHGIADACGVDRSALVGFSWGATITRNIAALSDRVTRAVMIGTYFGTIFTDEYRAKLLEPYSGDPIMTARIQGTPAWDGVEPADLRCPALIVAGTDDGNVVKVLTTQRAAIEAAGFTLQCLMVWIIAGWSRRLNCAAACARVYR